MKQVLILTKTNWGEAPRIRHQITRLLKEKGFSITYVEKNSYRSLLIKNRKEEGMEFYSHAELIHHQLRYFPLIQWANNLIVRFYLRRIMKEVEFDFIMNFCYDYSFLKEIAPGKKIITMIEDDFESQAKFGMRKQIRNQVRKTCQNSDWTLTVSYPLQEKLVGYTSKVKMLFPWSERLYSKPVAGMERNTVLYFGYVHRLDWSMVFRLVNETQYKFRFVGPTGKSADLKMINELRSCKNFEYVSYSRIEQLALDDVFCSILPYNPQLESVQACTISNRAFNLLSLGLPLAYANLAALIESPETVIRKNQTFEQYVETLGFFKAHFYDSQNDISAFLGNHYKEDRWLVLKAAIEE